MNPSNSSYISRRGVLRAAASIGALGALSGISRSEAQTADKPAIKKGAVILFQGDSITDAGRKKDILLPNHKDGLGNGYAAMIAGDLLLSHREMDLQCHNRGISGNKVPDLAKRWDQDTLALKPDVLSIMIGVNDLWHTFAFGSKYKGTLDDYETGYRALLKRTKNELPDVHIVICEPFTTRDGNHFKALDGYRAVSKKLAEEMNLTFVPFQSIFDDAVQAADRQFWLWDGIHPSIAGHLIMARKWREVVGI